MNNSEYQKKWREENREHIKEYSKLWREENREHIKEYVRNNPSYKKWRANNPDRFKANNARYYKDNRDIILSKMRKYHEDNREEAQSRGKKYYEKNREALKAKSREYHKNNREVINAKAREYRKKNREVLNTKARERYLKKKKIAHTLNDIKSFFTSKLWPYTTDGKNEISRCMKEIMGDVNPTQKNSFLSMPNLGRELNLLQDVIRFEDSVGIERDAKLFRSIQRAFAKFFPTMKVEKDCINNYAINTDKVFDVVHLDYNGFLIEPHLKATEKLIGDGTMTFVTLNMHKRFEKMENYRPLEELLGLGNVVFQKEYYGKKKCPMITVGLTA